MYESSVAAFYRRFILLDKKAYDGYRFKTSRPITISGLWVVQFVFIHGQNQECINYECGDLAIENAKIHARNIHEIYRVCIDSSGEMPFILPTYCSTCKKLYWGNSIPKKETSPCGDCVNADIKRIIDTNVESSNGVSYVYLMHSVKDNLYKIGFSANPIKRLKTLQTGNGNEIKLIGLLRGGVIQEKAIHEYFKDLKIKNEWFKADERILDFFNSYKFSNELNLK